MHISCIFKGLFCPGIIKLTNVPRVIGQLRDDGRHKVIRGRMEDLQVAPGNEKLQCSAVLWHRLMKYSLVLNCEVQ